MTCQETVGLLAEFLDQTLGPDAVAALEAHLQDCEPCRSYTNTYRATKGLVGEVGRMAMPADLKARLRAFLLDQLAKETS